MIRHRRVRSSDLPLICSFPQNAEELYYLFPTAQYPLRVEQLAAALAERIAPTVVEANGRVVAFADLYRVKQQEYCNIGNVIVAPEARRRGMARYLITQMIKIARKRQGAQQVRISCFNHNTSALLLYAGLGFVSFALKERFDWRGERVALIHLRKVFVS